MSSVTFADRPRPTFASPRLPAFRPLRRSLRTVMLAYSALLGVVLLDTRAALGPGCDKLAGSLHVATLAPAPRPMDPLLQPALVGGAMPRGFADTAPLASDFQFSAPQPSVVVADVESDDPAIPDAPVASPLVAVDVPLPTPRPADLDVATRLAEAAPAPIARTPFRVSSRSATQIAASQTPSDNRSFFEKFFGIEAPRGPQLAYANPEDGFFSTMRRATGGGNPAANYGANTAVYEIAGHTVYMPDGSRLEAHSGLRERLDDPRFVHERMRGPTPPHAYDLTLRERLFHGVQALRLNPVGGSGVFGRTGLLAHTYMLGPNGDSNGCVSFRNYKAFLQAYMNGEVRRLVVVAKLI